MASKDDSPHHEISVRVAPSGGGHMAGTRLNGGRPRRAGLLSGCIGLSALLALAGTTAGGLSAARPAPATACGGLVADSTFKDEVTSLGRAHACEHLQLRSQPEVPASDVQRVAAATRTAPASRIGRWSAARNPGTDTVGIAAVLLHTGRVLLVGENVNAGENTPAYVFNPVTGRGHAVTAPAPIFCSSLTPLSDGRILSVGGADPNPHGINDVWLFDPRTEQWLPQPATANARYYPTSTRLPNGRVVIAAGVEEDGQTNNGDVEVYRPPAAGGSLGALSVVGPEHPTANYPHQLVMPDGRMMQIDRTQTYALNPATWGWSTLRTQIRSTGEGSAHLMLPGGPAGSSRVMIIGGQLGGHARASTLTFDYARRAQGWRRSTPMPSRRAHMNVVQVPDGSAYAIGGNSEGLRGTPQRRTMHYDPATRRWRNLAAQAPRRAYHSTAVLLPDGRIMSAGDNKVGGGRQLIDFYSPPYLFRGPRPRITRAPRTVHHGERFVIRTRGRKLSGAVLMAPGATTHANEMNARHVPLAVTRTSGGFRARGPSRTVAPAGHYMLFVLRANGVPSVARWVHVTR
jgi:hypothetical protein